MTPKKPMTPKNPTQAEIDILISPRNQPITPEYIEAARNAKPDDTTKHVPPKPFEPPASDEKMLAWIHEAATGDLRRDGDSPHDVARRRLGDQVRDIRKEGKQVYIPWDFDSPADHISYRLARARLSKAKRSDTSA